MQIDELIDVKNISVTNDPLTKDQAIDRLVQLLSESGVVDDSEDVTKAIFKRENEISTSVGYGVAIPHARSKAVNKASIAILKDLNGIEWGEDRVNLVFMIVAEEAASDEHLKMLSKISTFLMDEVFRAKLLVATSSKEILDVLLQQEAETTVNEVNKNSDRKSVV